MKIAYAKSRSDASVKREGTEDDFEAHKRRRLAEKGELFSLFIYSFPLWYSYTKLRTMLTPTP
jgi:hypothetical protein